jgi:hypothetical protein
MGHLGLGDAEASIVRQVALLRFLGCTADTSDTARMVGGDDLSFLATMAPAVMGTRAGAGRRLVTSVGRGEPALRRAALVAGALADRGGVGVGHDAAGGGDPVETGIHTSMRTCSAYSVQSRADGTMQRRSASSGIRVKPRPGRTSNTQRLC